MKKILFILPNMEGGGSEKVMATILRHLDRKKFKPLLLLLEKKGPFLKKLPEDLEIIDLNSRRARYALWGIVKTVAKQKPDIVFSTLGHLNLLISIIRPFFGK